MNLEDIATVLFALGVAGLVWCGLFIAYQLGRASVHLENLQNVISRTKTGT